MREVDFSDRTVARRWREIKSDFREDIISWTRNLLKRLLETWLGEELEVYLRAGRHARWPRPPSRAWSRTSTRYLPSSAVPPLTGCID